MTYIQDLEKNGFAIIENVLSENGVHNILDEISAITENFSKDAHGIRDILKKSPFILDFGLRSDLFKMVCNIYETPVSLVKATYFNKTPDVNWKVPYHQDVTILVKQKLEAEGFGPWTIKEDIHHVQAPQNVLDNVTAVRCHLDENSEDNGTIKVIPASHKQGKLTAAELRDIYSEKDEIVCYAPKGSIMLMKPLLVHASSKGANPSNRRVLHFEYASHKLPHGLEWHECYTNETV